jgi:hypothetical protein
MKPEQVAEYLMENPQAKTKKPEWVETYGDK